MGASISPTEPFRSAERDESPFASHETQLLVEPEPGVAGLEAPSLGQPFAEEAVKTSRYNNFVARYWRGEFSLGLSYWVFGFFGGTVVALVAVLVATAVSVNAGYEPRMIFAALAMTWLGMVAVSIWQLVGVWRSANRHIEKRVLLGKRAPWARLAKLGVILGALSLVVQFGGAVPQITEISRIAFMDDPDLPAYSIRVMRSGTEAEITGGFKYGLTNELLRILGASPQIRVLHLTSLGGRIGEAEKLNKIIRERGLVTYVANHCMSACTFAFAAGRERWLRDGAALGFHAGAFPGMTKVEMANALRSQNDLLIAAGFAPEFVSRALATPHNDMLIPTSDELLRARAISATSDGSDFAASGYGAGVSREEMAAKLAHALPVLATMKERLPEDYASIVDGYYDGYVIGQSEAEIVAAARAKLSRVISANLPFSDDAVLVDYGKLFAEQYTALGAKNPTLCYLYISGTGGARNLSSELPSELVQRELTLSDRVIATASERQVVSQSVSNPLWEKIGVEIAKRIGAEKLALLRELKPDVSRHSDYCRVWTALYQEVTNLEEQEAGILMRQLLNAK
jgi:hypothetical protein